MVLNYILVGCPWLIEMNMAWKLKALKLSILLRTTSRLDWQLYVHGSDRCWDVCRVCPSQVDQYGRLDLTWPQLPPPFKRNCVWEEWVAVHKLGSKESNSSIIPRQTYIFCYHQACTTFRIYKSLEIDTEERLNRNNISKQFLLSFHRGTQQRYVYITLSSIRFFQEKRMLPNGNM